MKFLSLAPSFSTGQDAPDFVLTLLNDTQKTLNVLELRTTSAIVLDGKPYPCQIVKVAGNTDIPPGQTYPLALSLDAYLPGAQKKLYSPVLKRWRWKVPLKSGTHTLSVRIGNRQSEPITFIWDDTAPLLYR